MIDLLMSIPVANVIIGGAVTLPLMMFFTICIDTFSAITILGIRVVILLLKYCKLGLHCYNCDYCYNYFNYCFSLLIRLQVMVLILSLGLISIAFVLNRCSIIITINVILFIITNYNVSIFFFFSFCVLMLLISCIYYHQYP